MPWSSVTGDDTLPSRTIYRPAAYLAPPPAVRRIPAIFAINVNMWCGLVKPVSPGGIILDPFMGGASTGVAALRQDYQFIEIKTSQEYFDIACLRLGKDLKLSMG